ncbi:unnamed protein product [Effrenium voratum]|nr:unnamed protein product [Effrenium voratum]
MGADGLPLEMRRQFLRLGKQALSTWNGCLGVESLLAPLKLPWDLTRGGRLLLDVGANTGRASEAMVSVLGQASGCGEVETLELIAFEPHPVNQAELQKLLKRMASPGRRLLSVAAAVSAAPGHAELFGLSGTDLGSSLSPHVNVMRERWLANVSRSVAVVSLESFLEVDRKVFLLKVDAEGFDPLVLKGADRLLRKRRVRFLVFEVDRAWHKAGHGISLEQVVSRLFRLGYFCFVMHPEVLVPVYGIWWNPTYNSFTWANVFCALRNDPALFAVFVSYSFGNLSLQYAAHELLPQSLNATLRGLLAPVRRVSPRGNKRRRMRVLRFGDTSDAFAAKAACTAFHMHHVQSRLEHLEIFCCELRETLEDRLMLVLADLVPELLQKLQRQAEEVADRASKLQELEVRVEMVSRRIGTQDERLQSCAERCERTPLQLRSLCREELQRRLSEEDLPATALAVAKQQEALDEVRLQLQRLLDRLEWGGLLERTRWRPD